MLPGDPLDDPQAVAVAGVSTAPASALIGPTTVGDDDACPAGAEPGADDDVEPPVLERVRDQVVERPLDASRVDEHKGRAELAVQGQRPAAPGGRAAPALHA